MASTFGTWFTQLQRPPEAWPGVHASEEPLETGPVLSCARKPELREGRPLALAYRSTENAKDTGVCERRGQGICTGAYTGGPGRAPQSVSGRRGIRRTRNREEMGKTKNRRSEASHQQG